MAQNTLKKGKTSYKGMTGRTFGRWTVLDSFITSPKGEIKWLCRCECGTKRYVLERSLIYGRSTSCGCKKRKGKPKDITGQKFERLTALYMLPKRDKSGSVYWHCKCDCGNEIDVSYNNLVHCGMKSCGCKKKEHDKALGGYLTRVGGTMLDIINSKKTPCDNTTGHKGVYKVRGKYLAKIVFQKKQYFLGSYESIEDAAAAREEAEELLFGKTAEYIKMWKEKADKDPTWAKQNPVKIQVSKDDGKLTVEYSPKLCK